MENIEEIKTEIKENEIDPNEGKSEENNISIFSYIYNSIVNTVYYYFG